MLNSVLGIIEKDFDDISSCPSENKNQITFKKKLSDYKMNVKEIFLFT
jgi:hypothetical protein